MKIFTIFSHQLAEDQKLDLENNWGNPEIILLPNDLQRVWRYVPPTGLVSGYVRPVYDWLVRSRAKARTSDLVLIQGEFGATVWLAQAVCQMGCVPIYATKEVEKRLLSNGEVMTHIYKHVCFRKYEILSFPE